jgi:hypothetical protein
VVLIVACVAPRAQVGQLRIIIGILSVPELPSALTLHYWETRTLQCGLRARMCRTNVQISFNVLNHVQIMQEAHENTRLRPHLHDANNRVGCKITGPLKFGSYTGPPPGGDYYDVITS